MASTARYFDKFTFINISTGEKYEIGDIAEKATKAEEISPYTAQGEKSVADINSLSFDDVKNGYVYRASDSGTIINGHDGDSFDIEKNHDIVCIVTDEDKKEFHFEPLSGFGGNDKEAIKFVEQTLTEEQRLQARTNIGAMSASESFMPPDASVVKYETQTLTDSQKLQARENIGAVSKEELDNSAAMVKIRSWR